MTHLAPVVRLALLYGAGVAAGLAGAGWWIAPLGLLLAFLAPHRASARPTVACLYGVVLAAGFLSATGARVRREACRSVPIGRSDVVRGRFLATPRDGAAPFRLDSGCGVVTVVLPSPDAISGDTAPDGAAPAAEPRAGRALEVRGIWRSGRVRPWLQARETRKGVDRSGPLPALRWSAVRWRDDLVGRLHRLYPGHAHLVAALVLARREGLDEDLRAAFALSGIAHLLAISGFHVGLIAALLYGGWRSVRGSRRTAIVAASVGSWIYVGLIGFPDAACRAALILTCLALTRMRGYPPSRWGPLATAALFLVLLDPTRLSGPGFQLSFAGAAGLVAWAKPLERRLGGVLRDSGNGRVPEGLSATLASGLAAGLAATLATLPIVAWHFEYVSLVGIPVTLVATPLVSLALPGALLTLGLDAVWSAGASFLAGGVASVLDALVAVTTTVGGWEWIAAWTTRPAVAATCGGVLVAGWVSRSPRIGGRVRRRLTVVYAAALGVGWPVLLELDGRVRLEILMLDVGQGDAIAVRTPSGGWVLVDAGPPGPDAPAPHPVVHALRARGVRRLEALVLTHPDLDHIGGAAAVIDAFEPRLVMDPLLPAPKHEYATLVEHAAARGVRWAAARAGDSFELGGVTFRVLHPSELPTDPREGNAASVVLLVSWGRFDALLTGDAYVDVERAIAERAGDIEILKVGHHGSATSTDSTFLATVRPEVALVSVGRGNRYGHPAPAVLRRLSAVGARTYRTDQLGTVRAVVGRDGSVRITTSRGRVRTTEGGASAPGSGSPSRPPSGALTSR
ncbi:MAG: hypothetical protein AMS19_09270 [Gemmatimonas sp. SG8_23]|nr:MAG: hypothetical protein AMS19_09270 [Gemmatimonas sp. SG8_23]